MQVSEIQSHEHKVGKSLGDGKFLEFRFEACWAMRTIGGLMNRLQVDRVLKAILDGVDDYSEIGKLAEVDPVELVEHEEVLDRAIALMRGFYKYGHENMKPAGLPPPKNPYYNPSKEIDAQTPEYYAYEAVQRGNADRGRCIWICEQFGLQAAAAETAIDNVIMPWRELNGWRTYVRQEHNGRYVLQDKPPAKLKRHLDKILQELGVI